MTHQSTDTSPELSEAEEALIKVAEAFLELPPAAEAAALLHQVLNADTGLLVRVQEIVQAAVEWVREKGPIGGDPWFNLAHDRLDGLSSDLFAFATHADQLDLPAVLRGLGPTVAPAVDRSSAALLKSPAQLALHNRAQQATAAEAHAAGTASESTKLGRG